MVWRRLQRLEGPSDLDKLCALRHDRAQTGHVQASYMKMRVFNHARSLPWSLCHGNMGENLEALSQSPEAPVEELAAKA